MNNNFLDNFPRTVCANVLLLDNKIEGWKVGFHSYLEVPTGFMKQDREEDYTMEYTKWTVNNIDECNQVFKNLAPKWFQQWELADDYRLTVPYGIDILNNHSFVKCQNEEWSNNACLGYIIKGMQQIGKNEDEIRIIVNAARRKFDFVSVTEAREIFNKSSYWEAEK